MPTVDGHVHVFRAASERYPRATHLLFPAELEAPVEELLATMETHAIGHAVLVALSPHDDYLAECLIAHPHRFAGIGVLDRAGSGDGDDVRRRFERSGLSGLRIHHLGDVRATSTADLDAGPALRVLAELDGIVWLYLPVEQLQLLPLVLDEFPRLRVVLNHLGWPLPDDFAVDELGRPSVRGPIPPLTFPTVQALADYPSVHLMFSGEYAFSGEDFPFSDLTEYVGALYRAFGAERMLWASDYPWIKEQPGYEAQLHLVDHYLPKLGAGERAAIMGTTAARLFGFQA
jgi:L-fuconolactonase